MTYARITPLLVLLALPACPSSGTHTDTNPAVLWLALDGDELHVKLIESQPRPF